MGSIIAINPKYVYVQATEPTDKTKGKLWYNTSENKIYSSNGTSYVAITGDTLPFAIQRDETNYSDNTGTTYSEIKTFTIDDHYVYSTLVQMASGGSGTVGVQVTYNYTDETSDTVVIQNQTGLMAFDNNNPTKTVASVLVERKNAYPTGNCSVTYMELKEFI